MLRRIVWAAPLMAAMSIAAPALADELSIGGFAHDTKFGVSGTPHEDGTEDIQLMYRTKPFHVVWVLNPMIYAKAQVNLEGRTNFFTVGAEFRKHLFHTRFYGDVAVGGAYVDGYNTYPDHFNVDSTPVPGPVGPRLPMSHATMRTCAYRSALRLWARTSCSTPTSRSAMR